MTDTPAAPTTEAGRELESAFIAAMDGARIGVLPVMNEAGYYSGFRDHILAIEAEAKQQAVERMQAMRRDYRTMPHAEFPVKWPDWRDYDEVLPTNCSCQECHLWRI